MTPRDTALRHLREWAEASGDQLAYDAEAVEQLLLDHELPVAESPRAALLCALLDALLYAAQLALGEHRDDVERHAAHDRVAALLLEVGTLAAELQRRGGR